MSWVPEKMEEYGWLDSVLMRILKCGSIPHHVAFIMDGNRRFANQNKIQKIRGHSQGFDKLAETLRWCHDLGVREVTVYAFSIENYKRDAKEVEGLFDLAREKFRRLINERDKLKEHGIRVNILGNLSLLPVDLRELVSQASRAAAGDDRPLTLNIAFSYTARDEMSAAVRIVAAGVARGALLPSDISPGLLGRCLYTGATSASPHPRPDLIVRTSGETRLSDFLLWQADFAVTYFAQVLWPDFSLRNLMKAVFHYQLHRGQMDVPDDEDVRPAPSVQSELVTPAAETAARRPSAAAAAAATDGGKWSGASAAAESSLDRIDKFLTALNAERRRLGLPDDNAADDAAAAAETRHSQ